MQFVVIGRDGTDAEAMDRRLKARDAHLALGDKMFAEGSLLFGVALLNDDGKMCGSVMIADFPSRTELDAWLAVEPYVTGEVWKDIEISECRVGPSFMGALEALQGKTA
ncbi:MAG: YciI family protein [Alphaproteobacteria bacterium]|nr:YciI family protein [Alphaproteobacteria bacterium]